MKAGLQVCGKFLKITYQVLSRDDFKGFISRYVGTGIPGAQVRLSSEDFDWGISLTWYKIVIFRVVVIGRNSLLRFVLHIFLFVDQCVKLSQLLTSWVEVYVFQSLTKWVVTDQFYFGGGSSIYSVGWFALMAMVLGVHRSEWLLSSGSH